MHTYKVTLKSDTGRVRITRGRGEYVTLRLTKLA